MRRPWLQRLLDRNIAILVVVVLFGQLLASVLLYALVMRPQTVRLAEATAEMADTIGRSMAQMSPGERRALVARFNADDAVLIRPGETAPAAGYRRPTLVERAFIAAISRRLNHGQPVEWRSDRRGRLWVRLWLGGEDWWVSLTPERLRAPLTSTLIALSTALIAAVAGGVALQRLIDRPLRRLVEAVDSFEPERTRAALPQDGPQEVAAVARAFNRMTERLAWQEAERALMLGAVSHDLRTPLTRLRLSLEMLHDSDVELLAGARRQVDRIEVMLGQFLELARSFESEAVVECDVVALLAGAALDGGLGCDLTLDLPERLGARLRPTAIGRAVANLLGNAGRHGQAPFFLRARAAQGRLAIAVGDSGEGFDPAAAEAYCRPFTRGDEARGGGGAGLGLAIVARIAAAHGGRLLFERREGAFWAQLELPLEAKA
jgi:two-component system osmolarity sensor histidine kinase EnvZ